MVTTGGWPYCLQVQALARRSGYTLLCGKYYKDGYTGYGLRSQRHLDWGDPAYLASLATKIESEHERVGGELVLIGVSYSGFGIATLASHHPELHPNRLIVIDSFLDLDRAQSGACLGPGDRARNRSGSDRLRCIARAADGEHRRSGPTRSIRDTTHRHLEHLA